MKNNSRPRPGKDGPGSGRGFRSGPVLLVSSAHLVHDVYTGFLPPLLPLLVERMGIGYTMAGFMAVLQRLPTLLNPLMGTLAERISPRRLMVGAILCTTMAMSLLGAAPNPIWLGGLLLLTGVSAAVFHIPSPVMVRHLAGSRLGRGMSFFMLGGEIARTLGPVVILAAVSLWGLEGTWRLIPFGFAMALLLNRGLGRTVSPSNPLPRRKIPGVPERGNARRFFLLVGGYLMCRAGIKAALTIFLPVYMGRRGFSLWGGGISLAVLQFSGAAGTLCWGAWSDALGRRRTLLLTGFMTPLFMLGFASFSGVMAWFFLVVMGFTLFAQGPVLLALVQDVGGRRPEFFNAVYMTVNFIINALVVMALGWGGDRFGLEAVVPLTAWPGFAALFFAWRMKNTEITGI